MLAQVVDEGERLTEDELVGTCVLLLNAGHEATVNATLLGWRQLFRHPDQLARLRAEPALVPTAVDELLRFDTPWQMFERWVLDDTQLHGVRIPRGAELGLLFGSANRDPDVFQDPDQLRCEACWSGSHIWSPSRNPGSARTTSSEDSTGPACRCEGYEPGAR